MKLIVALPAFLIVATVASCSSTRYGDAQAQETVNVDWGSTDLQTFSAHMVESLLESPALSYFAGPAKGDDMRVIAYMGGVSNETKEHVNTRGVTDSIRTALLQSGRFRFVAGEPGQALGGLDHQRSRGAHHRRRKAGQRVRPDDLRLLAARPVNPRKC